MSFLELTIAWSLQILLIGLCAEMCAPLLARAHPRVRARFWLAALLLGLGAPWLLSHAKSAGFISDGEVLTVTSDAVNRVLQSVGPSWQDALFVVWSAIALIQIIRLARGLHRLASITAEARPLEIAGSPGLRVRESGSVQSPAASFLGRVILVPTHFGSLPDSWRRAALIHETIHLRRGHGILLLLEELVLALFWFHPMVFRLIRKVRDSREEMVDAATIETGETHDDYRQMLIGLAARIKIPAPAVSGTTALGARIESLMILERNPMPITSTPRLLVAGFALLCAAGVASAAVPIGPAPQDAASGEKKKAKEAPRRVLSRVNPVFPQAMKDQKEEGVVALAVTVGPDGVPKSVRNRPLSHRVHPELVKAAIEALQQWRWEAGEGTVEMTHAINFRLNNPAEKK